MFLSLKPLSLPPRHPERRALLRQIDAALLTDGWFRVPIDEETAAAVDNAFAEAKQFLSRPEAERLAYTRERALEQGCAGFTYLPVGAEPLYDADAATTQRVHSLNLHEALSAEEVDARLHDQTPYERALALSYHAWPTEPSLAPLLAAAAELRSRLRGSLCEPLLHAFAARGCRGAGGVGAESARMHRCVHVTGVAWRRGGDAGEAVLRRAIGQHLAATTARVPAFGRCVGGHLGRLCAHRLRGLLLAAPRQARVAAERARRRLALRAALGGAVLLRPRGRHARATLGGVLCCHAAPRVADSGGAASAPLLRLFSSFR
mmetsp:Transcript_18123/g.57905  ORF Transcript_18123/g.57905 Transcript_18123/m.57905 type:complete len:319 (-) Transcript_18123:76-1032(-)